MQSPTSVNIFEGILEGRLTYPPKGSSASIRSHFYTSWHKTLAELKTSEKIK